MVFATAVPMSAPTSSNTAAMAMPWFAVKTFVATTVANELAASWKPLISSNNSATKMIRKTTRTGAVMAQECFRTMWKTTLPASRLRSKTFSKSS